MTEFTAVGTLARGNPKVGGTWKYIVEVDGKQVYTSKPLKDYNQMEVKISVKLPRNARELTLKVDSLENTIADWSVWANPKFTK